MEAENEKAADFDSSAEVVGHEQQWNLSWWGEFTLLLSQYPTPPHPHHYPTGI